jgi:hypothetical protein
MLHLPMGSADDIPIPALEEVLVVALELGPPLTIGRLATGGVRAIQPVVGGIVEDGSGIGIVAGGLETRLKRKDGVTAIEANYLLVMHDGTPIRAHGTGYFTQDENFEGTRMSVVFEVDEGSAHAWLATRAFIGERPAGTSALRIAKIV